MGPDVPPDRVEAVRRAFMAALADPELLSEAKAMKLEIEEPMNGADLQQTITRLMATPPDIIAKAQKAAALKR